MAVKKSLGFAWWFCSLISIFIFCALGALGGEYLSPLKIAHARFFMFPFGKEQLIVLQPGFLRKLLSDQAAIPRPWAVDHGV